ncbi:MAG TPA: ABC transporter permease [Clostridiales bacterium]|nr:ABC transporter permease [Clostridiales bacterium]
MRGFMVFIKKELLEQVRTYRLWILFAVFLVIGMMSPLMAKLMPEIFSSLDMEGLVIQVPEPTVYDAYAQFFKNLTQMGILGVLLVFGGTLSNELARGTLVNILAKGLPRRTVLLSKYAAAVLVWTAGYALAIATDYGYTVYLFPNGGVANLFFSLFCLWLFVCFVISLILLSSTIAPGSFGGLILSAVALVVMLMLGMVPKAGRYNPVTLASVNTALLEGAKSVSDLTITVSITVVLILSCLIASILIFEKKKL